MSQIITGLDKLKVIDVNLSFTDPLNLMKNLKSYISRSLNLAHQIATNNKTVSGIINCPIRKNLLAKMAGVTEYLVSKCFER